jgi:hypothetical protein
MDTYIYITVVLILMVIIWACETAACMQWGRIIKQAYLELSRDLGESQITVPNAGGGTIWKRPPGWEIFNLVSLMDRDPLQITAELRLRLYAGYAATPDPDAVRKQIQILRSQPGVVYDEIDRTIQLTASSPSQLLERAHQLVQVTYGDPDPIPVTGQTVKQQIQDYVRMYA